MHYYRTEKGFIFWRVKFGADAYKTQILFQVPGKWDLARDKNGSTVTCGHYSGELMDFTTVNQSLG